MSVDIMNLFKHRYYFLEIFLSHERKYTCFECQVDQWYSTFILIILDLCGNGGNNYGYVEENTLLQGVPNNFSGVRNASVAYLI